MICPKCGDMELFDRTHYYSCERIAFPIDGCFLCGYMEFREFIPVVREIPKGDGPGIKEVIRRKPIVQEIFAERKAKLLAALAKIDGEILARSGENGKDRDLQQA